MGSKVQVVTPGPDSFRDPACPVTTSQWAGAVTVKVKLAFRSGCSNTAKTRRASATSNWEYR